MIFHFQDLLYYTFFLINFIYISSVYFKYISIIIFKFIKNKKRSAQIFFYYFYIFFICLTMHISYNFIFNFQDQILL